MASNEIRCDGESSSPPSELVKTIVLVGKTGSGKSATGNSILGRRAFKSMTSSTGVTSACEMHTTVLENGQSLAVIDTPGLFDYSADPEFIRNEMLKCFDMAKDGIHAILLIMSIRTRFSREEEAGVVMLQEFFGPKIMDYMGVVLTGGDEFEEYDLTLDSYLSGNDCPDLLKETLKMCGDRRVLFNNKTKDEVEKSKQLKQFLVLLDEVVNKNGGKPYTKKLFLEHEGATKKLHAETAKVSSSEEDIILIHKSYSHEAKLEIAQLRAQLDAQSAQMKSKDEIHKLQLEYLESSYKSKNDNHQNIPQKLCGYLSQQFKQYQVNRHLDSRILQYVVLRRDLMNSWAPERTVTQCCHAAVAAIWLHKDDTETLLYFSPSNPDSMHKITIVVEGEYQILQLSEELKAGGIAHKLWVEQPEDIPTCLATKPYPMNLVSPFFRRFSSGY